MGEIVVGKGREWGLSPAEFFNLTDVPPEIEWLANIQNPNTRAAYQHDVVEFRRFVGIKRLVEFRTVARAHVIAWREHLENKKDAPATVRRKLAALSSLFAYLSEHNAVLHNPVDGVKRPKVSRGEGATPALSDEQARALLNAPVGDSLKAKRDRAILATLLYHGLRREELCKLKVKDLQRRDGVLQFRVQGKGGKVRYIPVGMKAQRLITEYLEAAGHKEKVEEPLFRPVRNHVTGELNKPLHPGSVYQEIVLRYGRGVGITEDVRGFCVHSLRATAATSALAHGADIAKVQEWLGHANVSTTRIYDRRRWRPEESPTFRVEY